MLVKLPEVEGTLVMGQPNSSAPTVPPVHHKDIAESYEAGQHSDRHGGAPGDPAHAAVRPGCD